MDEQIRPINRLPHAEACARAARILAPRTMPKGLPVKMTANRLILLLQIYRDGSTLERRIGTFESDLRVLIAARLVNHVVDRIPELMTTNEGDVYIKRLLEIGP